jgi:hypothetical protein
VSANNLAAIGCYWKLGFAQVGSWLNAITAGTHSIDVVWMSSATFRRIIAVPASEPPMPLTSLSSRLAFEANSWRRGDDESLHKKQSHRSP